jgi:hypothetical protein
MEYTMRAGKGPSIPPIVGVALFALCAVSPPALAQTVPDTATTDASRERVIITNMTAQRKSRVYGLLSKILRRDKGDSLETTGSEIWSVPKSKFPRLAKRLEGLGHKVVKLRENWNHILPRLKNLVALTPAQRGFIKRITGSPGTVSVGVHKMEHAGAVEYALTQGESKVVLPVSEGTNVTLVRTRPIAKTESGSTWRGEVVETGEPAVLMLWKDGHLSGYFGYRGHVFMVNHIGDAIYTMAEMDTDKLPPDHPSSRQGKSADVAHRVSSATPRPAPPVPEVAPFPDAERKALEAKKITIDLMIVYTKNAASRYIGQPADLLALAIEEANETFRNSGLGNISLRLVHAQEIDYDESGADHFELLYGLVDGVGLFKDVKKLRNEKRADIVGLIVDDPKGCGLSTRVGAESEEAFFVVHHSCAAITNSIAHEIGHILGARHDRIVDANDTPFAYAHGYINGTKWRDIMSYNDGCGGCPRIPYWSNPRIMYKGEPTGTPANDNARVILEQAERVSTFRYHGADPVAWRGSIPPEAAALPGAKHLASAALRHSQKRSAQLRHPARSIQSMRSHTTSVGRSTRLKAAKKTRLRIARRSCPILP